MLTINFRPLAFILNKPFSKKSLQIVSLLHFLNDKYFSRYILLTDHGSLPDYLYFLRYWAICMLLQVKFLKASGHDIKQNHC